MLVDKHLLFQIIFTEAGWLFWNIIVSSKCITIFSIVYLIAFFQLPQVTRMNAFIFRLIIQLRRTVIYFRKKDLCPPQFYDEYIVNVKFKIRIKKKIVNNIGLYVTYTIDLPSS